MRFLQACLAAGIFFAFGMPCRASPTEDGCTHAIVVHAAEPSGPYQAVVDETVCDGDYGSDVTATVRLVGPGTTREGVAVLGVDTGGHAEDRPHLAWSAPAVLDVTVPNLSFLKVLTRAAQGVHVRLHFDPDEPAARAAWLKQHGLAPD